jgi:hypothetical protein
MEAVTRVSRDQRTREGPGTWTTQELKPWAYGLSSCAAARRVAATFRYTRTLITTRRFWARPALVAFGATGLSEP